MATRGHALSVQELREAGPTVPLWPIAVQALGVSKGHGYALARRGEFPAKVLKLGATYRVVTADLLRVLGEDPLAAA